MDVSHCLVDAIFETTTISASKTINREAKMKRWTFERWSGGIHATMTPYFNLFYCTIEGSEDGCGWVNKTCRFRGQ